MIEDDASKARRNLVAFSGAVLFALWLDVPLDTLLEDAVKLKTKAQTPAILKAILAVLAYLGLRYVFLVEKPMLGVLKKKADAFFAHAIERLARVELQKTYSEELKHFRQSPFTLLSAAIGNVEGVDNLKIVTDRPPDRVKCQVLATVTSGARVGINFEWDRAENFRIGQQGIEPIVAPITSIFRTAPRERVALGMVAWGRAILYSDVAVEFAAPTALYTLAVAWCLYTLLPQVW